MDIDKLLEQRERTHGDFAHVAACAQELKAILRLQPGWGEITPKARESLEMICVKIARICNGKPTAAQHWEDVAGYAQLNLKEPKQ